MSRPTIYLTIALVALVTGFWVLDAPQPQSIASGPSPVTVAPAPTVPVLTAVETTTTVAPTTTVTMSVPLGLTDGATVLATAQRGEQSRLSVPVAPTTTVPTGLWGQPFAPAGLDNCDEMRLLPGAVGSAVGVPSGSAGAKSNCRQRGIRQDVLLSRVLASCTSYPVYQHRSDPTGLDTRET